MEKISQIIEKRKYVRVSLLNPLSAILKIAKINGKVIDEEIGIIKVLNISGGGLSFNSELKLEENTASNHIKYILSINVDEIPFSIATYILRCTKTEDGYNYGCVFDMSDESRTSLLAGIYHLENINKE